MKASGEEILAGVVMGVALLLLALFVLAKCNPCG